MPTCAYSYTNGVCMKMQTIQIRHVPVNLHLHPASTLPAFRGSVRVGHYEFNSHQTLVE